MSYGEIETVETKITRYVPSAFRSQFHVRQEWESNSGYYYRNYDIETKEYSEEYVCSIYTSETEIDSIFKKFLKKKEEENERKYRKILKNQIDKKSDEFNREYSSNLKHINSYQKELLKTFKTSENTLAAFKCEDEVINQRKEELEKEIRLFKENSEKEIQKLLKTQEDKILNLNNQINKQLLLLPSSQLNTILSEIKKMDFSLNIDFEQNNENLIKAQIKLNNLISISNLMQQFKKSFSLKPQYIHFIDDVNRKIKYADLISQNIVGEIQNKMKEILAEVKFETLMKNDQEKMIELEHQIKLIDQIAVKSNQIQIDNYRNIYIEKSKTVFEKRESFNGWLSPEVNRELEDILSRFESYAGFEVYDIHQIKEMDKIIEQLTSLKRKHDQIKTYKQEFDKEVEIYNDAFLQYYGTYPEEENFIFNFNNHDEIINQIRKHTENIMLLKQKKNHDMVVSEVYTEYLKKGYACLDKDVAIGLNERYVFVKKEEPFFATIVDIDKDGKVKYQDYPLLLVFHGKYIHSKLDQKLLNRLNHVCEKKQALLKENEKNKKYDSIDDIVFYKLSQEDKVIEYLKYYEIPFKSDAEKILDREKMEENGFIDYNIEETKTLSMGVRSISNLNHNVAKRVDN